MTSRGSPVSSPIKVKVAQLVPRTAQAVVTGQDSPHSPLTLQLSQGLRQVHVSPLRAAVEMQLLPFSLLHLLRCTPLQSSTLSTHEVPDARQNQPKPPNSCTTSWQILVGCLPGPGPLTPQKREKERETRVLCSPQKAPRFLLALFISTFPASRKDDPAQFPSGIVACCSPQGITPEIMR